MLAAAVLAVAGCSKAGDKPAPTAPGPIYQGPAYLRGTVGSMASLQGYEPELVSGFGVVMGLDGTGSAEVPAFLRQWLITELARDGFGSARSGLQALTPERLLADPSTTVVAVQGFIPPGAVKGKRFDVLVSALDAQTTSLEGGTLWVTKLRVGGTDPNLKFTFSEAVAKGPIYVSPDAATTGSGSGGFSGSGLAKEHTPQAMIASGGAVTQTRPLMLVLNSPSYSRVRGITDRINERFPVSPREKRPTAEGQDDLRIRLNVPAEYARDPSELLDLIAHTFVFRTPGFEEAKGAQLAELLVKQPELARDIGLTWRALGKRSVSAFRPLYEHEDVGVRLTALEAGAYLGDERASEALSELADYGDPTVRTRVAGALVHLPKSLRGSAALRRLLDDRVTPVRVAAYESLAKNRDPLVDRVPVRGVNGLKFVIDRVSSSRPMVLITQEEYPRLVLFGSQMGFDDAALGSVWKGRLMVRQDTYTASHEGAEPQRYLTLFYQRPGVGGGGDPVVHRMVPTVATLAFVLGHKPTAAVPQSGLNLSYGQVAEAIYQMCRGGSIPAEVVVQRSELAERIAQYKEAQQVDGRPESEGGGTEMAGAVGGGDGPRGGRVTRLPVVGDPPPGGAYQPAEEGGEVEAPPRPLVGIPEETLQPGGEIRQVGSTPPVSPSAGGFELEPFDWDMGASTPQENTTPPARPESGDPIGLPPSEDVPMDPFAGEFDGGGF